MNLKNFIKLFSIVISFFALSSKAQASEEKRDLYVFFIVADSAYCHPQSQFCDPSKDLRLTFFEKAKDFAQDCSFCDFMIVLVKTQQKKGFKFVGPSGYKQPHFYNIYEKLYFYRDGELSFEKEIAGGLSDKPFIPLPLVGKVTYLLQEKKLAIENKIFMKDFFKDTYRHQFAFFLGHKMPESTRRGYFHSDSKVKFSLSLFLEGLNDLSFSINGSSKPFDALFLGQCASTIETIYEVVEKNTARFVLSSPDIVPFLGLSSWNLKAFHKHLETSSVKKALNTWLERTFTPGTKENVSEKILTSYTLSLYDIDFLQSMKSSFKKAIDTFKQDETYKSQKKERKKAYDMAAGDFSEENESLALVKGESFSQFDCKNIKSLENFLETTSVAVTTHTSQKNFLSILFPAEEDKEKESKKHSGWSCL